MSPATAPAEPSAQKGEKINVKTVTTSKRLNPGSNPKEYVTMIMATNGKIYPLKTVEVKDPKFSKNEEIFVEEVSNGEMYEGKPVVVRVKE